MTYIHVHFTSSSSVALDWPGTHPADKATDGDSDFTGTLCRQ